MGAPGIQMLGMEGIRLRLEVKKTSQATEQGLNFNRYQLLQRNMLLGIQRVIKKRRSNINLAKGGGLITPRASR